MALRLVALAIDAHDPPALARFWALALGWEVGSTAADGTVALVPTDGTRFDVQLVPAAVPKTGKNPIHPDLTTASLADQQGSVERFLAAGATPAVDALPGHPLGRTHPLELRRLSPRCSPSSSGCCGRGCRRR